MCCMFCIYTLIVVYISALVPFAVKHKQNRTELCNYLAIWTICDSEMIAGRLVSMEGKSGTRHHPHNTKPELCRHINDQTDELTVSAAGIPVPAECGPVHMYRVFVKARLFPWAQAP